MQALLTKTILQFLALTDQEKILQLREQIDELMEAAKVQMEEMYERVVAAVRDEPELMTDNYLLAKLFVTAYFEEGRPFGPPTRYLEQKLQKIKLAL